MAWQNGLLKRRCQTLTGRKRLNEKRGGKFVKILLRKLEYPGRRDFAIFQNNTVKPVRKGAGIQKNKVENFLSQVGVREMSVQDGFRLFPFLTTLLRILRRIATVMARRTVFATILGVQVGSTAASQTQAERKQTTNHHPTQPSSTTFRHIQSYYRKNYHQTLWKSTIFATFAYSQPKH